MIAGYSETARLLTPRMRDVLGAGARGLSIAATARELGIAEPTVRNIRAAARERLGAASWTAAVVLYASGSAS